jgi:hypothetical protein
MNKTFIDKYNTEYTVKTITAIAAYNGADESKRQNALLVSNEKDGEKFESVVFGWEMPADLGEFESMSEDSSMWDSDSEVLETVR